MTARKEQKTYVLLDEWHESFYTGSLEQIKNVIADVLGENLDVAEEMLSSFTVYEVGKPADIELDLEPKVFIRLPAA